MHTIKFILAVMRDGEPRTSYELTDLLYGPQTDGAAWFRASALCDYLVQRGKLTRAGKRDHRTVYRIAETLENRN